MPAELKKPVIVETGAKHEEALDGWVLVSVEDIKTADTSIPAAMISGVKKGVTTETTWEEPMKAIATGVGLVLGGTVRLVAVVSASALNGFIEGVSPSR